MKRSRDNSRGIPPGIRKKCRNQTAAIPEGVSEDASEGIPGGVSEIEKICERIAKKYWDKFLTREESINHGENI